MLHAMSALRRSLALLFALAPCAVVHAQWDTGPVVAPRVEYRTFASAAAGATVSFHVWTPPNYDTEPNRRFPVLYWLHGSGSPTSSVAPMSSLFANAIAEGQMPPTIVVFPNGWDYGMWTDSKDGLRPLDRQSQLARQLRRAAGMVDMAVGEQDLLDGDSRLLDGIQDHRNVAAGIDDGTHLPLIVINERAILLEGSDGDDEGLELCHGRSA